MYMYMYICIYNIDIVVIVMNTAGVDYHFHREELYLTLSNGNILQYDISVPVTSTGTLMTSLIPPPTILYTAGEGNTLGSITVDWLYDDIYWIENEGSMTKVMGNVGVTKHAHVEP